MTKRSCCYDPVHKFDLFNPTISSPYLARAGAMLYPLVAAGPGSFIPESIK